MSASHVHAVCAAARLSLVDDILVTAGWRQNETGWIPPEHYRRAIEITHGRGEWSRDNAIRFMTVADERTCVSVAS